MRSSFLRHKTVPVARDTSSIARAMSASQFVSAPIMINNLMLIN